MGGKDRTAFRMGRLVSLDELGLGADEPRAGGESAMHEQLMAGRVMQALDELTPQQRLSFLLKHREGMTYEEISAAVGASTGTVKKAVFRAVAKLRERFGIQTQADRFSSFAAGESR